MMPELKYCPTCSKVMQVIVDPKKDPEDPDDFVWYEDMLHKCYFCGYMENFEGNVIHKPLYIRKCPVCKTDMEAVIFPINVKSVWSGQEVFLCKRCGYSEDKHGNQIPKWYG